MPNAPLPAEELARLAKITSPTICNAIETFNVRRPSAPHPRPRHVCRATGGRTAHSAENLRCCVTVLFPSPALPAVQLHHISVTRTGAAHLHRSALGCEHMCTHISVL